MRNHLHPIPEEVHFRDAVGTVHSDLVYRQVQIERKLLLSDVNSLYVSDEKKRDDANASRSMVTVEMSG